jgi:hypothetical protein
LGAVLGVTLAVLNTLHALSAIRSRGLRWWRAIHAVLSGGARGGELEGQRRRVGQVLVPKRGIYAAGNRDVRYRVPLGGHDQGCQGSPIAMRPLS